MRLRDDTTCVSGSGLHRAVSPTTHLLGLRACVSSEKGKVRKTARFSAEKKTNKNNRNGLDDPGGTVLIMDGLAGNKWPKVRSQSHEPKNPEAKNGSGQKKAKPKPATVGTSGGGEGLGPDPASRGRR